MDDDDGICRELYKGPTQWQWRRGTTTTTIATLVTVYLHKDAHKLNCGCPIVDRANNWKYTHLSLHPPAKRETKYHQPSAIQLWSTKLSRLAGCPNRQHSPSVLLKQNIRLRFEGIKTTSGTALIPLSFASSLVWWRILNGCKRFSVSGNLVSRFGVSIRFSSYSTIPTYPKSSPRYFVLSSHHL